MKTHPLILILIGFLVLWNFSNTNYFELHLETYTKERDSTYNPRLDSILLEAPIVIFDTLEIPALTQYNDVIRISRESSWGVLSYYITIYNDNGIKRLELIRTAPYGYVEDVQYEKIISDSLYIALNQLIYNSELLEQQFNLEHYHYHCNDCPIYAITMRKGNFERAVSWNDLFNRSPLKTKAVSILRTVLTVAEYPYPKAIIENWPVKNDSIKYRIRFDDYELMKDYKAWYRNELLQRRYRGDEACFIFKIPVTDKRTLINDLSIFGVLENDSIAPINEIRLE